MGDDSVSVAGRLDDWFSGELRHASDIPVRFCCVDQLPDDRDAARIDSNFKLLVAMAHLDERPLLGEDLDNPETELGRLTLKIDLLVNAVGALLRHQLAVPPPSQIELSAAHIAWRHSAEAPSLVPGVTASVELYLHPVLLSPLQLYVRVTQAQENWRFGALVGLAELERSALERHIFLRHRRLVGERRTLSRKMSEHP
jgi:hypothetical protein